jgi:hypothetical protein
MDDPTDEPTQLRREAQLLRRYLLAPLLVGMLTGALCLVLLRLRVGFWPGHLPLLSLSWKFLLSLLVALGLGVAASWRLRKVLDAPNLLFVWLVYAMTGLFLFPVIDVGLDTSAPREVRAEVKSKSSFRRGGVGVAAYLTTITLEDTPPTTRVIEVGEATYASLQPGRSVPAFLHPGLLGDPWITLVEPGAR